MKSVNLFCLFMLLPVLAWAKPVEIFISGVEYPSLEAYKASKAELKNIQGVASAADEDFLRAKAKELGIDFDPKKVRTIAFNPPISVRTAEQLHAVSYEGGVGRVKADFEQNWDNPMPKFTISSGELEDRLKAVAGDRTEPVLIVSDANKLRVMALGKNKPSAQ